MLFIMSIGGRILKLLEGGREREGKGKGRKGKERKGRGEFLEGAWIFGCFPISFVLRCCYYSTLGVWGDDDTYHEELGIMEGQTGRT